MQQDDHEAGAEPSHTAGETQREAPDGDWVRASGVHTEQVIGGEAAPIEDAAGSRLIDYLVLGIEHILTGWDHLAFVFGLLLLAGRLGEVARLVTGFTLAHSLTLALAVMEVVHPRAAAVEAVIAFSVALVAIEKGWLVAGRPRVVPIAVLVGLATTTGAMELPLLTVGGLAIFTLCYFALLARSSTC